MKKYWRDSKEYQRILEVLDAYWLEEPDEKFVCVDLYFEHMNGMTQTKKISWTNPAVRGELKFNPMTLAELSEIEYVGHDRGGCLELVRDEEGIPVGVKNDRTGVIDYFKKVEKK